MSWFYSHFVSCFFHFFSNFFSSFLSTLFLQPRFTKALWGWQKSLHYLGNEEPLSCLLNPLILCKTELLAKPLSAPSLPVAFHPHENLRSELYSVVCVPFCLIFILSHQWCCMVVTEVCLFRNKLVHANQYSKFPALSWLLQKKANFSHGILRDTWFRWFAWFHPRLRCIGHILSIFLAYKDLICGVIDNKKASVLKYIWNIFFWSQTQFRLALMRIFCSEEDQKKDFVPAVLTCSGKWGGWGDSTDFQGTGGTSAQLWSAGSSPAAACPACPATESLCRALCSPGWVWWAGQVMSDRLFWRRCYFSNRISLKCTGLRNFLLGCPWLLKDTALHCLQSFLFLPFQSEVFCFSRRLYISAFNLFKWYKTKYKANLDFFQNWGFWITNTFPWNFKVIPNVLSLLYFLKWQKSKACNLLWETEKNRY